MQDAFALCTLAGEQLQPIDLFHGEVQHKEHCHHRQHTRHQHKKSPLQYTKSTKRNQIVEKSWALFQLTNLVKTGKIGITRLKRTFGGNDL
jgi:hypothetical protein